MTTNDARRSRRKPFTPAGTPRQQDAWTRRIERDLLSESKRIAREAARLAKLATEIEQRRLAQQPIDAYHLCRAINAGVAGYATSRLAGVNRSTPRAQILNKVLDIKPSPREYAHLALSEPPLEVEPICAANPPDALAQAIAIARSAAGDNVDWSREPLTDREAKIRRVWLNRQLEDVSGAGWLAISIARLGLHGKRPAPDLAAADAEAMRLLRDRQAAKDRAQFRELSNEIDEDGDAA